MTTRFEALDSGATTNALDPAIARWQADYQNTMKPGDAKIVKVADQQQQGQDAGEDKSPVKALLAEDPKELTPGLKTVQGLAGHFDKATDKAKALGEVKPEMEKTIAAADTAQSAALAHAKTEMTTLKPKLEADKQAMEKAMTPLQAAGSKVPEADQERVATEMKLYTDDKTSPALKKALETELSQYPGLVPAMQNLIAVEKQVEPDFKQLQTLQESVGKASEDAVISRIVYADMQQQGGDAKGAKQTQAEAMALQMGMSIEDFHKLQQQKAPQKP